GRGGAGGGGMGGRGGRGGGGGTAGPLTAPALICGCAGASTPELSCTVPESSALSASPPPGNGMVAIFCKPSRSLSTSAWSCGVVPIGGGETWKFSGVALGRARERFLLVARR